MILSDSSILEYIANDRLRIDPLGVGAIQPASVDIRLGYEFRTFLPGTLTAIDPMMRSMPTKLIRLTDVRSEFVLHPAEFVLGTTFETFTIPLDLVGRLEGRSGLGRLGLSIHSTAGFVDPGFMGSLTLELLNVAKLPVILRPEMPIGQMSFLKMTTQPNRPYGSPDLGSKYQGQAGPTASRLGE